MDLDLGCCCVFFFFFLITGGGFVDLVWCLYGYGFVLDVLQFSGENVF